MYQDSARFQARQARLSARFDKAMREKNLDEIVKARFAMLGYSYEGDETGGGSALDSITNAAVSLGSAYIASQTPPNQVLVPTRTNPPYAAPKSSSGIVLLLAVVLVVGLFVYKG